MQPDETVQDQTPTPAEVEEPVAEATSGEGSAAEATAAEQTSSTDELQEETPSEEKPKAAPRKTSRKRTTSSKSDTQKRTQTNAGQKTSAGKSSQPAATSGESVGSGELESLDGRPARLWDISDGKALPAGWARIAIDRVNRVSRMQKTVRRSASIPNVIYAACNTFIYDEALAGGLNLTMSQMAEAAFEQIPDDDEGIRRLLDNLPEQYLNKSIESQPRTVHLFEPTAVHMQSLAPMLRARGFAGMTGLVQAAALRELLLDLGVDVD